MCKWQYMLVILTFITASTCILHLEITRTDDYPHTMVEHSIEERVGSKLQLTCELKGAEYYGSFHKLVWGRRNNKLRFQNVADLVKLAKNGSKQLLELDPLNSPYMMNSGIITFKPLDVTDKGTYFCMNLERKLFKIVRIKVKEPVKCQLGQFKCEYGEKCIESNQVCDGIYQCIDQSDEEWGLCHYQKRCEGNTIRCGDGCIPTISCCDIRIDPNCPYIVRKSCCPPLNHIEADTNLIGVTDNIDNTPPPRPNPTPAHNIILSIATGIVVLTFCLIIYFCYNARNSHNSNQNGVPPTRPPIIRTEDNDNSSMRLTNLMGIGTSNSLEYLDLPPTYADSTRNTPINSPPSSTRSSLEDISEIDAVDHDATLPPTYDEALANLKLSNPPNSSRSIFLDVPDIRPGTSRDD